jgi:iron complex outermembrane receptor protein
MKRTHMKLKTRISAIAAVVSMQFLTSQVAVAQEQDAQADNDVEMIMVTGSFVRRSENFESPSPLAVVDSVAIDTIGAKNIADITQTLTINAGAENNPDAFTQNATVGTSNINLRGLGLSSTLVLLNNKRQVTNALTANDGSNFVDTSSLVPMIAINRVEIVKDGASALYGSDAVAGVVNFITKSDYDGTKISFDYQDGAHGDNKEFVIQGLWGLTGDDSSIMAAISYTSRTPLFTSDRRLSRTQDDQSTFGNPGSYFGLIPGNAAAPVIDPGCEAVGGIPVVVAPLPNGLNIGTCQFDFGDYFSFVPDETRVNGYIRASKSFSNDITWNTEIGYARNRAERGSSPTFPLLALPPVPTDNPGNPFGQPVAFLGRALGSGAEPDVANSESDTFRFSTSLQGELDTGFWELSYTKARNDYLFLQRDVLVQEFENALNGFGGSGCNPLSGVAGEGSCEYFNPFSSSFSTIPNSQSVLDSIIGTQIIDSTNDLQVVEAIYSTELFELDAGAAAIAIGAQWREEEFNQDFDSLSNQDRFGFVLGNPDLAGKLDVWAAFAELALPVSDTLDIQLAVRYEDYGGSVGSTLDPKLAASWRVSETLSLRGSVSTSFRAPSVFLRDGGFTTLGQLTDPLTTTTAFVGNRTTGNPDLTPEESTAFNVGFSFEPVDNLSIEVDYWSFDFEDLIIQENAQAILNDDPQNTDRVIRAGDPLNGPLIRVNTSYVNASYLETSGLDIVSSYRIETDMGVFLPNITATYIVDYELEDPQAGVIDGAGRRNFSNIGVSSPELKVNLGLSWQNGNHSASLFARYIDGYSDDQNCADGTSFSPDCTAGFQDIDSHLTIDAQYNVDIGSLLETDASYVLTLGGINITDEDPPQVFTNGGFDSKVHDPRGRQIYARFAMEF